mgnify:CR=1 FL=1
MNLEQFKNPGAKYRPAPFWSWNDNLDKDELKRQIREMAEKGWGSYFCHSRVGLVTGYLSDEWMDLIKACAEEAKATNTYAWLYDEDKWPSGYAGGEVGKFEEFRNRKLVLIRKNEITETDTILAEHEYNGETLLICKRVLPTGDDWCGGTCYTDLMNPEAVAYFIKCTHEKYKDACGEYFGKEIPGIFTDEPRYLMKTHYKGNKDNLPPYIPWSDWIPDYFFKLKGYSIMDHLKELFFNINDFLKVRFDFYDTATRLFVNSFTKQYADWCEKNNLIMTGHYVNEDTFMGQLSGAGAVMPHYEYLHLPGADKLSRNIKHHMTLKQLTSVTDQLQKERALCEAFGCIGQQSSFFTRKWIGDWMAAYGINFFNYHLSLYSMRGERKRDYPPNFYYQQPWWENESAFSDYISRLSYALSNGKRNLDILIIHPISTAWSVHTPIKEEKEAMGIPTMGEFNAMFDSLSYHLMTNKLDYHYGDEIIMENNACVKDGKLFVGCHGYSTVIVPPCVTIRRKTLDLLKEFASSSQDNLIIVMSPSPERIDGMAASIEWPSNTVFADTKEEVVSLLDSRYPERIRIEDTVTGENVAKIICHERINDVGSVIFIANTDEVNHYDTIISVKSICKPKILDLTTGLIKSIPLEKSNDTYKIRAEFKPAGSMLLYLPESEINVTESDEVLFIDSGVEFKKGYQVIKSINPCRVNILEENVLPLDKVTLYMDSVQVLKDEPVAKAWHGYFYKAPDGTPFKAEYTFNAVNAPQKGIFAAIEVAENLDRITINGIEVKPLKKKGEMGAFNPLKSWKDLNFTRVPLDGLVKDGLNTLIIEGKKVNNIIGTGYHSAVKDFKHHMPTEVETIYLAGDFTVKGENGVGFYIDGSGSNQNPYDLTSSGYPFYAGNAEFVYNIDIDNKDNSNIYIRINNVKAACIELTVNGLKAGVKLWEPYIYDASNLLVRGRNEIKIKASTTLFNLMGPNRYEEALENTHIGPATFTKFDTYTEKYALLPFGVGSIDILKI